MAEIDDKLARAKEKAAELKLLRDELGGKELDTRAADLKTEQQRSEDITGYGEIADIIGQGLVKFGAAKEGLDRGVEISPDIKGYDWKAARDRIQRKYEGRSKELAQERAGIDKLAESALNEEQPGLDQAMGVTDEKGLPVYQIQGKPGYYDANYQPVENVKKYEKEAPERASSYNTRVVEDTKMITEDGLPVYKKITTNRANPDDFSIELVDIEGAPLNKEIKPKVGIDPKSILSDKEASALAAAESSIEMFNVIDTDKKKYDTGPIASLRNWLGQKIGVDDSDVSAFKADVQDTLNRYIKAMTGAQMSEQEADRLMAAMPKFSDNDETFKKKLAKTKERIKLYNDAYIKRLKARGKNTSLGESTTETSAETGTVRLKYKDGKIYELDAKKAKQALQSKDWERE